MSANEPRKKHDINNLLRIAKEYRDVIFKKEIDDDLTEATRFCLSFNIKEGGNKVFTGILYKAYLLFSSAPLSKKDFTEEFNTLIEQQGTSKPYYMLNYKPAQLLNAAQKRRIKVDGN